MKSSHMSSSSSSVCVGTVVFDSSVATSGVGGAAAGAVAAGVRVTLGWHEQGFSRVRHVSQLSRAGGVGYVYTAKMMRARSLLKTYPGLAVVLDPAPVLRTMALRVEVESGPARKKQTDDMLSKSKDGEPGNKSGGALQSGDVQLYLLGPVVLLGYVAQNHARAVHSTSTKMRL